ncbi:MAG TPA: bifunctional 5,10-methylenetetrahydrofolate dehydrogenase/5,10-methenyltetrahydrofolate cyclohydrolase [Solirubrobacteraceae bacterium]|nr:bifunctional 5,10-methylenetetrahydrofolate dehydrogenase/5,10-methenyltetrahydrofolate cyclohydrolase [Solirubrobacteraceae bacterium]
MSATVIDGRAVAARMRSEVAAAVEAFRVEAGRRPHLATVLVGDDAGSQIYVANKHKAAEEAGIATTDHRLGPETTREELAALLDGLGADPEITGILLQIPLPDHLDPNEMVDRIPAAKDVDGLTVLSAGLLTQGRPGLRPCTPQGVIELLDAYGVPLEGAEAVVVGRSLLVGRPMAALLLQRNATVTTAHSRTRDLGAVCARADVLVAAVGMPTLIEGDWVKPGAAVIDVGVNRMDAGLVGDVDFDTARERAAVITPVPGGVGPMTIACLLRNTLLAAQRQLEDSIAAPAA